MIKGKRASRKSDVVDEPDTTPLPKSVKEDCKEITPAADIMHLNTMPHLVTLSCNAHCATAAPFLVSVKLLDKLESL